jgi:membrane peptidoglycan carboxypeptidase
MSPQPGYAGQPSGVRRTRRRRGLTIGPGCIFGCIGLVGVMVLGFLIVSFVIYEQYSNRLEDEIAKLEDLTNYQSFETTVIYDRHGNELYEVINEGRRTNSADQIPEHMIQATIAREDDTFMKTGDRHLQHCLQGGSTSSTGISCRRQHDHAAADPQRAVHRRSQIRAVAQPQDGRGAAGGESHAAHEQRRILELYLNDIRLAIVWSRSGGATCFGKPASQLTLGEAALLAGLPQAPADLDPLNPDPNVQRRVMERRKLVLDLMVEENFITRAEADAAFGEPLYFVSPNIQLDSAPHMVVYAQDELENLLLTRLNLSQEDVKRMIARGGLRVYTSVDMEPALAEDPRRLVARCAMRTT